MSKHRIISVTEIEDEDWLMEQVIRGKVSAGRVVLPAELRKEFGIKNGADVVFSRTEHGIEIKTLDEGVQSRQCHGFPRNPGRFHPGSGLSPPLDQLGAIEREASFLVK